MTVKRFAVISDIHGNLEGLEAVLRVIRRKGISDIICLGDVIGYGADPEACWKLCKDCCSVILKGNHEAIYLGESDDSECSTMGKQSAIWTREHMPDKYRVELAALPCMWKDGQKAFFHTAPGRERRWPYLNTSEQIVEAFHGEEQPLLFYGHTHRPRLTVVGEDGVCREDQLAVQRHLRRKVDLTKGKYYINPGSCGQQRDRHTDASFAVCAIDGRYAAIELLRIPYRRFRAYRKTMHNGCGIAAATYLIREKWRRDTFAVFDNWCKRICR